MPRDRETHKAKGFSFLMYEDQRSTVLAVDNMNGAKVLGRTVRVDHVRSYRHPDKTNEEGDRVEAEEPTYNAMPPLIGGGGKSQGPASYRSPLISNSPFRSQMTLTTPPIPMLVNLRMTKTRWQRTSRRRSGKRSRQRKRKKKSPRRRIARKPESTRTRLRKQRPPGKGKRKNARKESVPILVSMTVIVDLEISRGNESVPSGSRRTANLLCGQEVLILRTGCRIIMENRLALARYLLRLEIDRQ